MNLKIFDSDKKNSESITKANEDAADLNKDILPKEREEIIEWLQSVKFPQKLFGGVDEVAVWRKIAELDGLYAKALEVEKVRYNALLERYHNTAVEIIKQLKEEQETASSEANDK